MSRFWVMRNGVGLAPDDAESYVEFSKLPWKKPLLIEVKQPRNAGQHRLFWLLCHRVASAIGAHPANVCDILKIATGHCEVIRTKRYGDVRLPKSISFAQMDQTEFREFFDRCIDTISLEWGAERPEVLSAVEDLLIPTEQH